MDISNILDFLKVLAANNNREWFQEHKAEYLSVQADFEELLGIVIARISLFDESVAHVLPQDCTYRIYRDVRFSSDKSPYKTHIGGYINARGKNPIIVAIICIWSRAIVCWPEEAGACLPICCGLYGSRYVTVSMSSGPL